MLWALSSVNSDSHSEMSHAGGARGKAKEVIEAHLAAVTRDYIVQPRLGTAKWISTLHLFSYAIFGDHSVFGRIGCRTMAFVISLGKL